MKDRAWLRISIMVAVLLAAFLAAYRIYTGGSKIEVSSNEHYGLVQEVYSLRGKIPITDLEGDTDLFDVRAIVPHEHYEQSLEAGEFLLNLLVVIPPGSQFALTDATYENGKLIDGGGEYRSGYVEKLDESGRWNIVSGLHLHTKHGEDYNGDTFPHLVGVEGAPHTLAASFPIHDPGKYRITYKFRRCDGVIHNPRVPFSTFGEVCTVSHTVTVPEPSEKKFDLVALGTTNLSEHPDSNGLYLYLLLRSNDGTIPHLKSERVLFEVLKNGEWVEAARSDSGYDAASAYENGSGDSGLAYSFRHPYTGEREDNYFSLRAWLHLEIPGAEYRITFDLRENADGSGERRPLTLRLNFS